MIGFCKDRSVICQLFVRYGLQVHISASLYSELWRYAGCYGAMPAAMASSRLPRGYTERLKASFSLLTCKRKREWCGYFDGIIVLLTCTVGDRDPQACGARERVRRRVIEAATTQGRNGKAVKVLSVHETRTL